MTATTTTTRAKKAPVTKKTIPVSKTIAAAPPTAATDHTPVATMKKLGLQAIGLVEQIHGLFPKLVGMTEEDRKASSGKLREGEVAALMAILNVTAMFPQYFQSLAGQDFGDDPNTFESQLLLDRLARRAVLVDVSNALHALATSFDDTVLKVGDLVRPPALAAYKIAAPLAKTNGQIRTKLKPALDFYASLGKKAAKTRKKKVANQKKAASTGAAATS